MNRIDLIKTIEQIDFGSETWEWLDLMETIAGELQKEAMIQEKGFRADTPYKKYLLCAINKDLQTINATYFLLRCEMIHQAASHVRLFCESLITMRYVAMERESRAAQFWGYMGIEAYKVTEALLELESPTANPEHVLRMVKFKESIKPAHEKARPHYSYEDKKKRVRPFINWCNKSVSVQAQQCGKRYSRLYNSVYRQMSAYIHGSAWSLRRQLSYSRDHYDPRVVLIDISSMIRTLAAVWVEWATFCCEELGWRLQNTIIFVQETVSDLDNKHFG
ncbi:DUF5677 domain-containing protein [uncultured Desulfosarcina sp.]|uniref:DUF5677 domain-containing protein n=1 Tax=uncultured Desulfosarcina sp. TaxID=218289 RepID=UPI0029C7DD52|nr:DUF5677 domain-containing protein [uncultured Desulfosarcina sp.]